jgi:diphthamide biosynthesis protein 2
VIGCWESSLVDSKDFWKPVITPFELELALQGDVNRVWTGAWRSDYQNLLDGAAKRPYNGAENGLGDSEAGENLNLVEDDMSEPESAPPEFDLRTGRYVSHTRPMRDPYDTAVRSKPAGGTSATALAKRAKGDLATIGGAISPGAEFLRSQRTWKGLGSDFEVKYEEDGDADSTLVTEGRKGIARGYTVGEFEEKR